MAGHNGSEQVAILLRNRWPQWIGISGYNASEYAPGKRDCVFTEKVPPLGDKGDIMLIDFSQAVMGLRRELVIDKSIHVGWLTDTSGYRGIIRCDFQGTWDKPITPKNGDTLSWAVCLEAR